MPVYETGICIFCKQQSDRLLPETGWDPETGLPVVGFICQYCRNYLYSYRGIKAKRIDLPLDLSYNADGGDTIGFIH